MRLLGLARIFINLGGVPLLPLIFCVRRVYVRVYVRACGRGGREG